MREHLLSYSLFSSTCWAWLSSQANPVKGRFCKVPSTYFAFQAPPWVRAKMLKEMEAGSWRGKAKGESEGKPSQKPNVTAQYIEDTMRTTGILHDCPIDFLSAESGELDAFQKCFSSDAQTICWPQETACSALLQKTSATVIGVLLSPSLQQLNG